MSSYFDEDRTDVDELGVIVFFDRHSEELVGLRDQGSQLGFLLATGKQTLE